MFQRTAFGEPRSELAALHVHDVHVPEWIAWVPLLLGIVAFGVYPHALFHVTDGAVQGLTAVFSGGAG